MLSLRRLFQRYRVWRFKGLYYRYNTLRASPYSLLRLAVDIDKELLKFYTPDIGQQIVLNTGFLHAEDALNWINVFIANIEEAIPVSDRVTMVLHSQRQTTLENFLTNSHGGTLTPDELYEPLLLSLRKLFDVYHSFPSSHQKSHYTRRIELLCPNLTSILEGLLLVALTV